LQKKNKTVFGKQFENRWPWARMDGLLFAAAENPRAGNIFVEFAWWKERRTNFVPRRFVAKGQKVCRGSAGCNPSPGQKGHGMAADPFAAVSCENFLCPLYSCEGLSDPRPSV